MVARCTEHGDAIGRSRPMLLKNSPERNLVFGGSDEVTGSAAVISSILAF
jgi:hypothetical protein